MHRVEVSAAAGLTGVENAMAHAVTSPAKKTSPAKSLHSRKVRAGLAALGAGMGLAVLAAPCAAAEGDTPAADPPAPEAVVVDPAAALGAGPEAVSLTTAAAAGVPHLPAPDNLPPGTTDAPAEGRNMGYIRDLWHAVRTQDVTMSDALLLLAQRPMSANTPLDQMSPHERPLPPGSLPPLEAPLPVDALPSLDASLPADAPAPAVEPAVPTP